MKTCISHKRKCNMCKKRVFYTIRIDIRTDIMPGFSTTRIGGKFCRKCAMKMGVKDK